MATALDFIKGGLRRCQAYQSGEQIAEPDAQDCLDTFNDWLASMSLDKAMVFGSQEYILQWNPLQAQYKIGNPTNSELGLPNFTGKVTLGSNIITSVTNVPSQLVVGTSTLNASTITDLAQVFPAGTYVTAVSSNTVTVNSNATSTPSSNPDVLSFTVPGDFGIPRPINITAGFTRFNSLDFWLDVYADQQEYTSILYKQQPGPWPTIGWYNYTYPYALLNVYQTPGNAAEVHLFADTILTSVTLNQTILMPQGYARAIKWCLAAEFCGEFGYPLTEGMKRNSAESLALIKARNAKPAQKSAYDRILLRRGRADYGWILHGGYGR